MSLNEISKLTDMGFTEEQAVKALKITNNNVEQAISYLFEDPIEIDPPNENNQLVKYDDTINISNPQNIPDLSIYQKQLQNQSESQSEQQASQESVQQVDEYAEELGQSIYDDIANFKRAETDPPVILVHKARFLENYIVPVIIVLSQIDKFRSILFKNTSFDYGYDRDWFNNNTKLEVNIPEHLNEAQASSYKFIIEIQRLLGYMDGLSNRSFTSAKNLYNNLPTDFKKELATKVEEVEDLLDKFYNSLTYNYALLFDGNNELDTLFKSYVESVPDEVRNDLSVLTIDFEARSQMIYESLNSMFWSDEESIGDIRFVNVAPIITLQISGDDSGYHVNPFTLHEYFYPELYSAKYSNLIVEMNTRRLEIISERNAITKEIMSMSAFEGKKIKVFLESSINELNKIFEDDAKKDLSKLNDDIIKEEARLTAKLTELNNYYSKLDIRNYDNILEQISSNPDLESPTVYILTGVIISDTEYFYKTKKYAKEDEDWVYFKATCSNIKQINDYGLEIMNFEAMQEYVYEITKDPITSIVLLYSSNELFNESINIETADNLRDFFKKDNDELTNYLVEFNKNMESANSDDDLSYDDDINKQIIDEETPEPIAKADSNESKLVDL